MEQLYEFRSRYISEYNEKIIVISGSYEKLLKEHGASLSTIDKSSLEFKNDRLKKYIMADWKALSYLSV